MPSNLLLLSFQANPYRDTAVPKLHRFVIYNVTNAVSLANGETTEVLVEELGPYVYRAYTTEYNETFEPDGTKVTFNEMVTYRFLPNASAGTLSDTIYTGWLAYEAVLAEAGGLEQLQIAASGTAAFVLIEAYAQVLCQLDATLNGSVYQCRLASYGQWGNLTGNLAAQVPVGKSWAESKLALNTLAVLQPTLAAVVRRMAGLDVPVYPEFGVFLHNGNATDFFNASKTMDVFEEFPCPLAGINSTSGTPMSNSSTGRGYFSCGLSFYLYFSLLGMPCSAELIEWLIEKNPDVTTVFPLPETMLHYLASFIYLSLGNELSQATLEARALSTDRRYRTCENRKNHTGSERCVYICWCF